MTETQAAARRDRPSLDAILSATRARVEALRPRQAALERAAAEAPTPPAWVAGLAGPDVAIIAEVKRRSPSAGPIAPDLDPVRHAAACATGGARAISVLTEGPHFGGSLDDLRRVREALPLPVLRKDFLIDPVQLYESRAARASAVLLIVRALPAGMLRMLAGLAGDLGLARLVEVHAPEELDVALAVEPECIGVNARDLDTFRVDVPGMAAVLQRIPPGILAVAESGLATRADAEQVAAWGADAILVGTALAAAPDPTAAVRALAGVPRQPGGTTGDASS